MNKKLILGLLILFTNNLLAFDIVEIAKKNHEEYQKKKQLEEQEIKKQIELKEKNKPTKKELHKMIYSGSIKEQLEVSKNKDTAKITLAKLSMTKIVQTKCNVALNPSTQFGTLMYLSDDKNIIVRKCLTLNPNLPKNVMEKLSNDHIDIKEYLMKREDLPESITKKIYHEVRHKQNQDKFFNLAPSYYDSIPASNRDDDFEGSLNILLSKNSLANGLIMKQQLVGLTIQLFAYVFKPFYQKFTEKDFKQLTSEEIIYNDRKENLIKQARHYDNDILKQRIREKNDYYKSKNVDNVEVKIYEDIYNEFYNIKNLEEQLNKGK